MSRLPSLTYRNCSACLEFRQDSQDSQDIRTLLTVVLHATE